MASAREKAEQHGQAVVAGRMGEVVGDFVPDAFTAFQQYRKLPPQPTTRAEIVSQRKEGDSEVFEIKYSNDQDSLTIRSWWQEQGDTWKIVKAEPVS